MSQFIPLYDLESLTKAQRQEYIKNVCNHMGVPPELNLVMLTYLDEDGEGPRRLVAYAKRGATEIIRNNRSISVTDLTSKEVGGSIVLTASGKNDTGRQEIATGSKWSKDLTGKDLDDAIMTAQTRACRRMTLQFVGAGVLDESEVNPRKPVQLKETAFTSVATAPQPSVRPSSGPGKDVTLISPSQDPQTQAQVAAVIAVRELSKVESDILSDKQDGPYISETQQQFEARQKQLRADAIANLNTKAAPAEPTTPSGATFEQQPEAKPKRKYTRKPRVDMGPSVPPLQTTMPAVTGNGTMPAVTGAPITVAFVIPPPITVLPLTPPVSVAARLSPEQVKPYRQRQFKFVNTLEENGFLPKEGMGNQDKMRAFAGLLFPEVTNFNELTIVQWEKYLTTIETKLNTVGPKETIKYIEDAIGI